jgi:hypothetical protein
MVPRFRQSQLSSQKLHLQGYNRFQSFDSRGRSISAQSRAALKVFPVLSSDISVPTVATDSPGFHSFALAISPVALSLPSEHPVRRPQTARIRFDRQHSVRDVSPMSVTILLKGSRDSTRLRKSSNVIEF